jgi:molybdopterin synthase sulfur carrier subunit
MIKIFLPEQLKKLTGHTEIGMSIGYGVTEEPIQHILEKLDLVYSGILERITPNGEIKFVNIFINGEDVRFLAGLQSKVKSGDEINIVPAIAGG